MFAKQSNQMRHTLAVLAVGTLLAGPATAAWLTHSQRVHSPIGKDSVAVEILAHGGGYVYLANHVNPLLLPVGANRRPVLVFTGADLNAIFGVGYMRPGENNSSYVTELYLDSTDFATTADGGFIVCGNYAEGSSNIGGSWEYGAFLLKIDAQRQPTWFRQYPQNLFTGLTDVQFRSVVETFRNGNPMYAVCGQVTWNGATILNEPLVAGFDSQGNIMWAHEIVGLNGGYGTANEIIVYNANQVAITGFAQGAPHIHCQNFQAYADVLVARFDNDGTPEFAGLYGQSTGVIAGQSVSYAETGASLTRVNNSNDLAITGTVQAWPMADECPGGAPIDEMLTFRIDPFGNVIWSNRYDIVGDSYALSPEQMKPVSIFLMIAANGWTTLNNAYSENISFFRLMAGDGSLAQQTEIYGGPQQEKAAGIIPLGPPWPYGALMLGTSSSYPTFGVVQKPLLIERMPSARKHCEDQDVYTSVVPYPLPVVQELLLAAPPLVMRSQPLEVWSMTVTDEVVCAKQLVGDLNGDGVIDFFDIDPFVLALFDPAGFAIAYPQVDRLAADANGDDVVDFFDIDGFLACLFGACP